MAESAAESAAAPELTANGVAAKVATDGDGKPAATVAAAAAVEDPTSGTAHGDVKTIGKPGDSAAEVAAAGSGGGGEGKPSAVTESVVAAMDIDVKVVPAEAAPAGAAAAAAESKETEDQRMGQEAMVVETPEKKARVEPSAEGKETPAPEAAAGQPQNPEDEDKYVEKMKEEAKVEENGGDGEEDSHKVGEEEAKPSSAGKRGRKRKSSLGSSSPVGSPLSPERTRPTRERKRAERYEVEDRRDKHDTPLEIKEGKGTAFKDIPNVAYKIGKRSRTDDLLHMLHILLFRRRAKQQTVKHNVLQFSGFVWETEDKDRTQVKEKLERYTREGLNQLLDLLDVQKGGKKEEQVHRIIEFLESPHKTTDSILEDKDKKGKKRKSSGSKGRTPKRAKKEGKAKKTGKSKDAPADGAEEEEEDDDDEDAEDKSGLEDETEGKKAIKLKEKSDGESEDVDSDEEDDDEVEKDGPASDEEEKVSAKGKEGGKKGSAKKATPVKAKKQTPKKRTPKKDSAKKTPSKKSTPKEKKSVKWKDGSNEEASKSGGKGKGKGSDSAEKSKSSSPRVSSPGDKVVKGQPTEEELKEKITELLNGADLKKVSLKNVREQLEKHFKCDLDSRKKSIKEIVYEVIPEDSDE